MIDGLPALTASPAAWPPSPEQLYLSAGTTRPLFQGDVFEDVPFVKARSAGNPANSPNVTVERRLVALVGYPCDIYDGGKPVKMQTVAPVTEAERAGIPPNWDGAFTYFPLPDLLGNGVMHAVDLRARANIDASYLTRDRRIRSLSRFGWAVLRQRLTLCSTRALLPLDGLDHIGATLWEEVHCWQQWCEGKGRAEAEFQRWLGEPDPMLSGFTRRSALDRGNHQAVRVSLERELRGAEIVR